MAKRVYRITVVAVVAALLICIVAAKSHSAQTGRPRPDRAPSGAVPLPTVLDVGGGKCTPCKMMIPILEELKKEYEGRAIIRVLDFADDWEEADRHEISVIPTQVFLDSDGKERFRHEGFMHKKDIVAKLAELGVAPSANGTDSAVGPIRKLFAALESSLKGAPAIALVAAFVWGILSVLLSPCHLSCIPLIIGFIDQQGRTGAKRACLIATMFSLGILVTIALVGVVTAALGRMLGDVGATGSYIVAGVFLLVGFYLLDVIPMPWSGPGQTSMRRRGLLAAFILGLVFGIAVGPCTFAYLAPMLGVAFKLASRNFLHAAGLLLLYGIGHCSVIVVAGTSAELVQQYLNWNESSKGAVAVKMACGVLVVLGGAYLVWKA